MSPADLSPDEEMSSSLGNRVLGISQPFHQRKKATDIIALIAGFNCGTLKLKVLLYCVL